MKNLRRLYGPLMAAALLASQGSFAENGTSVGLANPADVYCSLEGGNLSEVRTSAGEESFCQLGQASIDAWTIFRSLLGSQVEKAVDVYVNSATEVNPSLGAEENCQNLGGTVLAGTLEKDGSKFQICELSDGTNIGLETLQAGSAATGNEPMTHFLKRELARRTHNVEVVGLTGSNSQTVQSELQAAKVPDLLGEYILPRIDCSTVVYPGSPTTCSIGLGKMGSPIRVTGDSAKRLAAALASGVGRYAHGLGATLVTAFDLRCDQNGCTAAKVDLYTGTR